MGLNAQEYHPFPTKNTVWAESFHPSGGNYPNIYHYFALKDNDTTINGYLYHKLYFSYDTIFAEVNLCGALREENKRIYYYSIAPLSCLNIPIPLDTEVILNDFNLQIGDTITDKEFRVRYPGKLILIKIDSMIIGNEYRKVYNFGYPADYIIKQAKWVEGIGCLGGLLADEGYMPTNDLYSNLNCFIQNREILYHSNEQIQCYNKNTDVIPSIKANSKIKVIPNPVDKNTRIEFDKPEYQKLIISDQSGNKLNEYDLKNKLSLLIDRGELSSGLYFISVYDNKGNIQTLKMLLK